jgi:hypothetical protein
LAKITGGQAFQQDVKKEDGKMKRFIVSMGILALVFGFGGIAGAAPVTFNFDLANNANNVAIGTYMTGLYGSTVTVGATAHVSTNQDTLASDYTGDGYVESDAGSAGQADHAHNIQFNFVVPFTGLMTYDWGTYVDSFTGEYYNGSSWVVFQAYSNNNPGGFVRVYGATYTFNVPVYGLKFHDGGTGEVAIDNLTVNRAVPEPMSLLLLSLGLLGIGVARRKK